jgi:hypothetical protein
MGNNSLQMFGFTAVQGDVGAAGNGIISIGGYATIDGNLYYRSNIANFRRWLDESTFAGRARVEDEIALLVRALSRADSGAFLHDVVSDAFEN